MNSKAKTARVITLEVLVQEQKLKLKRERKDIMYIQNMLRRGTPILRTKMYNHYAISLLKQEQNVVYTGDGYITNVKEPKRKGYLMKTKMKQTTSVKETSNRSDQKYQ